MWSERSLILYHSRPSRKPLDNSA
ncbi:hypothetical protein [Marinimicrobium locisalis]